MPTILRVADVLDEIDDDNERGYEVVVEVESGGPLLHVIEVRHEHNDQQVVLVVE